MGRKKMVLSLLETVERKERYWGAARNAKRREAYRTDPEYRASVQQQVKESYRKSRMEKGYDVRNHDCRENITNLNKIGQKRFVTETTGETHEMLTLTPEEMARAFDRNSQVIYRWLSTNLFPPPGLMSYSHEKETTEEGDDRFLVYGEQEAKALMHVFGKHQETSQYYRLVHTQLTKDLFDASIKERLKLRDHNYEVEIAK